MKRRFTLILALIFGANCASDSVSQTGRSTNSNRNAPQVLTSATPAPEGKADVSSADSAKKKDVPSEFAEVDFANLSYPVDWKEYRGGTFISKQQLSKFEAHEFTRFSFKVVRGKFMLKKRDVITYPQGDVLK